MALTCTTQEAEVPTTFHSSFNFFFVCVSGVSAHCGRADFAALHPAFSPCERPFCYYCSSFVVCHGLYLWVGRAKATMLGLGASASAKGPLRKICPCSGLWSEGSYVALFLAHPSRHPLAVKAQ